MLSDLKNSGIKTYNGTLISVAYIEDDNPCIVVRYSIASASLRQVGLCVHLLPVKADNWACFSDYVTRSMKQYDGPNLGTSCSVPAWTCCA
jgi:hypothetical protein